MEVEYKILKFWAYYETVKFAWDQSGWLGRLEQGDFERAHQVRVLQRKAHKLFTYRRGMKRECITHNLGMTYRLNYMTRNYKMLLRVGVGFTVLK